MQKKIFATRLTFMYDVEQLNTSGANHFCAALLVQAIFVQLKVLRMLETKNIFEFEYLYNI